MRLVPAIVIAPCPYPSPEMENSSGAATLTLKGVGGAKDVSYSVAISKTVVIPIEDTTYYRQSDGTVHVVTNAALVDVYVIDR